MLRFLAAFVMLFVGLPATAQTIAQAPSGSQIVASGGLSVGDHPRRCDSESGWTRRLHRLASWQAGHRRKPTWLLVHRRAGNAPQLVFAGKSTSSFDQTWEEPWGEYSTIRNHYDELKVNFDKSKWMKRRMTVVFRIFDDGVGFRYELPDGASFTHANIADELTEFDVAEPGTAWWDRSAGMEPRGISLSPHAGRGDRHGAHAAHDPHRERPALVDPRGGVGRLFGHGPSARCRAGCSRRI